MTELIWDGKYKDGKKTTPVKIALPFQTIETVNESAADRAKNLDMFASGQKTEWRNRLIWGDKKYVLPALLPEFAGKVNLIYIDPPFDTGADFSFTTTIPESDESFHKEPSIIEQKAYRDTWGRGLDSYLQWFYETAILLRELLADNGSIYVHLDWHVGHYAKIVLDEVFGENNFRNEITWKKLTAAKAQSQYYSNVKDLIFFYTKTDNATFNKQFIPGEKDYKNYPYVEEGTNRAYGSFDFTQKGQGPARYFGQKKLVPPPGKHWIWTQEKINEGLKSGIIFFTGSGLPRIKRYLDEKKGNFIGDLWADEGVAPLSANSGERTFYNTQKPEALLNRIITASTNPNDLVLDCFCGSGTTAAVAEKLGRRWIACDLGRFAIHTTRKRLLQIERCKPFIVQNLGKYERQAWQAAEFEQVVNAKTKDEAYKKFILELYHAEPVSGHIWLHGIKGGKMVHVGSVDAPVTVTDVKSICAELWRIAGQGKDSPKELAVDILGWDFAFEVNEIAKQIAAEAKVKIHPKYIPREVMEKQAVEAGDIKFFELSALSLNVKTNKKTVSVELKDFTMPVDDIPEEVRSAIKHWSQFIDYWAIDWDYKNDTFHNMWQSYRTKKSPTLQHKITNTYETPGKYTILVKVIDILGNDTTKAVEIEVK
jgi:adenine specific DNA methylase Mod